jgi:hypothetical protein
MDHGKVLLFGTVLLLSLVTLVRDELVLPNGMRFAGRCVTGLAMLAAMIATAGLAWAVFAEP